MLVYVYNNDGFDSHEEPKRVTRTVEVEGSAGLVNIDYAEDGTVVGVELIDAARVTAEAE